MYSTSTGRGPGQLKMLLLRMVGSKQVGAFVILGDGIKGVGSIPSSKLQGFSGCFKTGDIIRVGFKRGLGGEVVRQVTSLRPSASRQYL